MIGSLPGAVLGLLRYGATPAAIGRMLASGTDPVLIDDDGAVSGRQLWTAALLTADRWSGDARPGHQRLGLIGRQDRLFVIGLLGASILGWDVVGLSPRQDDDRLISIVDDLALTAIAGSDAERVRRIAGPRVTLGLRDEPCPDQDRHRSRGRRIVQPTRPLRRGKLILLSSGTTGLPSGAARRRYGPALARPVHALWQTIRPVGGPMMIMAPLWHGYGLGMMLLALAGGVPVLVTGRRSSTGRSHIAELHRPRTMVVLPVQLAALVERWPSRPDSLHRVITGSAPLSPQLCRRALDVLGPRLINLYGSTEAGWATWATPADLDRVPGTIGRAAPGVRVKIIGGQLHVDSPLGTDPRRPTPTGDHGHYADDGLLVVDGRLDDTVIVDGNNVSLSAVQRALNECDGVVRATVRAEPDAIHGSRLIADLHTTTGVDLETISHRLSGRLDWYAVPRLDRSAR